MIEKEPLAALLRAGRRRDGRWSAANGWKITLVAGGTEAQDCAIAEYVVSVFVRAVSAA